VITPLSSFIVVSEISSSASFWPNADRFFASTSALFLYPCLCRARLHPAVGPTGSRSQRDEVVPSCTPAPEIVRTGASCMPEVTRKEYGVLYVMLKGIAC
jgi:hypothetical protein